MRPADTAELLKELAIDVREFVAKTIEPISAKQAEIEARVAQIPTEKAEPGPAGASAFDLACLAGFTGTEDDWLASLHGMDGPPGKHGQDGKSVSLDDLAPLLDAELSKRVAEIPAAKEGTSVTLDDVRPLVDEAVQAAVAGIPVPKDGASVTLDDVRPLIAEAVAAIPTPPPLSADDVRPIVHELVSVAVAEIPAPKDGTSVSLDDVRPLIKQAVADALLSDDAHTLVGSALQSLTEAISAKFASADHAG